MSRDVLATHFNTYPAGDPRYYVPLKERIEVVSKTPLDAVKKYHSDFYGTARGEISIVGDFDAQAIEATGEGAVRRLGLQGALCASGPRIPRCEAGALVVDTPDKENAVIRARPGVPSARR